MNKIFTIFCLFIFFTLSAEVISRIAGYRPWVPLPENDKKRFEPFSPFCVDSSLGYRFRSGTFRIIESAKDYFTATIDSNGHRITSRGFQNKNNATSAIHILGCSFTFGSGMDDSLTYPWLLQEEMPQYKVVNYAVPGYGVANSLTQLNHFIQLNSGDIILYAYFSIHDNRYERRVLKFMYGNPNLVGSLGFLTLDTNLVSHFIPYKYRLCTLSRFSALINLLEDKYNAYEDHQENYRYISQKAMRRMNEICASKGCSFIVVGMQNDQSTLDMLHYCSENGIHAIDISVDLNNPLYYQSPYNGHPNVTANRVFATRLQNYLLDLKKH